MDWFTGSKQGEAKRLIAQLSDVTQRDRAAQDLIRMGAEAVTPLIEALQTKDMSLLLYYEQILARIPSASPTLIKLLGSAHPVIRGRAAEVFAISKDKTAVPSLLDAVKGEYFTVRSRAALALGKIGDSKAIQPLLNLLKDPEDEVRIAACLALGLFRDPSTFDEITSVLLDDPKIEVRQAAASALGNTQHPAALPYLMEALHDSFWWYEREYAVGDLLLAIEKMGYPAVDPLGMSLYDMHHDVGKASAESLANFGTQSFAVLCEALTHPEMWIRIHAILGLSRIKDSRVTPVLLQMLNDPEREVKKQVIQSLGEIKDPRSASVLQQIMANRSDREFHALAKEALEKMT